MRARLRRLVAICLVVGGGGQVLSCSSKVCTAIGCGAGFEVRFQGSGGEWSPGTYNVTVIADGATASCEVTLPLGPCQTSSMACTGVRDWEVQYGGCALPPEQHALYGVTFWRATPANVQVVVRRDGQQVGAGTFTPTYQTSQPNGPGCGPTCYGAPAATIPIQLRRDQPDAGHCGRTDGAASVVVHLPDGSEVSCNHSTDGGPGSMPQPGVWTGRVTGSDATSLAVEVCAAGAGCVPNTLRVEARAPGLDLSQFPRAWVRVRAEVSRFRVCQQTLEITTADPTDGSPSQSPGGQLLLAVVDGGAAFAGAPYVVDRVPLGCSSERACGSPAPDDYAFDFKSASGADASLRVYMGETATWTSGGKPFTVRNLRSFQSGDCDDYWNWAYTIYADPK